MHDESPLREIIGPAVRRWPFLLACGLIGGLLGLLFSMLRPPRYEAKAVLGVSIQYAVTESLDLVVEDRALNRIAALARADSTLQETLDRMPESIKAQSGWRSVEDLMKVLRLDRRLSTWEFVALHTDPQTAAAAADAWAEAALSVFDEAAEHAWRAAVLLGEIPFDVDCAQERIGTYTEDIFAWRCWVSPLAFEDPEVVDQIRSEIMLSRGMLPNVTFELLRSASVPQEPVLWDRGLLVLSGAVAGFIIGLLSTALVFQSRNRRLES